jgi:hypothetical protein
MPDCPQVAKSLIDHLRPPLPRQRIRVHGERADHAGAFVDRGERQVPRQLLGPSAVQHRGEHLLVRPQ